MKRSILLLMVVVVVLGLAGCDLLGTKEVRYEVTNSSSSLNIRYLDEDGELINVYTTANFWSHSFTINRVASAIVAYVEAESTSGVIATVSVEILEDGFSEAFDSATAVNAFAQAVVVIE